MAVSDDVARSGCGVVTEGGESVRHCVGSWWAGWCCGEGMSPMVLMRFSVLRDDLDFGDFGLCLENEEMIN